MRLVEMLFKGVRVFVEADDAGRPIVADGRAAMRYKKDDDRVYRPSPANLVPISGAEIVDASPRAAVSARRAKPSGEAPASPPAGTVIAYTDGACSGNPGPAGLGYAIIGADGARVQRGEPLGRGTNNIAELTAILRVLQIQEGSAAPLVIHTDSTYAIGVLTQGWKAKANAELIAEIRRRLRAFPKVELRKVAGHAGVPENELVDELARRAAADQRPVEA
jgi:ribonuclease HI